MKITILKADRHIGENKLHSVLSK